MSEAITVDVDVVVVGAGLAGLIAAHDVAAAGASVQVVEARDRVGGRIVNHRFADGTTIEIGGQWVGPTHHRLLAAASRLGVAVFPTYTKGSSILEFGGRAHRYGGMVPPRISVAAMVDYVQAQLRLDRLARRVSVEAPWEAARAAQWDAMTLADWCRTAIRSAGARRLMELSTAAVFAADPDELSLLHYLFYLRSGEFSRGLARAQRHRFVGGSYEIAARQAAVLQRPVMLTSPVRTIAQDETSVTVRGDGFAIRAKRAIVAVPPPLAHEIGYQPALPPDRDALMRGTPMGSVVKILATYPTPFWRDRGLNGQVSSDAGPVRIVFDNSLPEGRPGVLVAFVEAGEAKRFRTLPADDRRRSVLDSLARHFGADARNPQEYVEKDWSAERWSGGCYGAFFPAGVWSRYGKALRPPVGRVHWAGSETSSTWAGYMEGAVRSGERAATEVLAGLNPSKRSWE